MRKKVVFIVFLMLILFNYSCKKDCSSFDNELLSWINYKKPDILIYTNQYGDSLKYYNGFQNKSTGYTINKDISSPCHSWARFKAYAVDTNDVIVLRIEKTKSDFAFTFLINYTYDSIYKKGYIKTYYTKIENDINTITIKGISYNESLVMQTDTNEFFGEGYYRKDIWKCIVVKDRGLMQFYEKSGMIWTLVE
jgi:hypothetical protein